MRKVKIIILGPVGCGKTRISNLLAEASNSSSLPYELRPTHGVRILEFDAKNVKFQNNNTDVEVQLWDCSGDERFVDCWPAMKKNVDGILFVYSSNDVNQIQKLELYYNYFVMQDNFSPRQCLVLSNNTENEEIEAQGLKIPVVFSRMSKASVNIETSSEKLRFDFNQFLSSVINNV